MSRTPVPILSVIRPNAAKRLARKLLEGAGGCWNYVGQKNARGYGFVPVMIKGRRYPILAHRLAWVLAHGEEVPDGKIICHRCNNPSCCNPDHLYAGTQQDNIDDMGVAGTRKRGPGHPMYGVRGAAHPASKYSQEQRNEAIKLRRGGMKLSKIGKLVGVPACTISLWWNKMLMESLQT